MPTRVSRRSEGPAKDAAALKGVLGSRDIGGFEVKTLLNARVAR